MPIGRLHTSVARIFGQRCFYLFVSLVLLIGSAPFLTGTFRGWLIVVAVQFVVLVATVAAVGRTVGPFVLALLIGIPAVGLQIMGALTGEQAELQGWTAGLFFVFYLITVVYLMRYVFSPEVMTEDKLFGAAAAYLLLGIIFAAAYRFEQSFDPGAFGLDADGKPRAYYDLIYMSFGILTSNGPGDLMPTGHRARALVILEMVTGPLFVAILVARIAGIYPQRPDGKGSGT